MPRMEHQPGGHNEGEMPPPELAHSGSLGSPLNRVLQKETKITPERRWAKDLIEQIPYEYLGITTEFIKKFPPEQAEGAAKKLLEIIKETSTGILRAPDQKTALKHCIEEAEKRLEQKKKIN